MNRSTVLALISLIAALGLIALWQYAPDDRPRCHPSDVECQDVRDSRG